MERMERVNSAFDLDYDYYRKNLPAIDDSEERDESTQLYEEIFESRKTFTILGLDSYITISKKSLNKIADMINCYPQEYILFTNHKVIDEDKFDKLIEKENDQLNPILIHEQNEDIDGFKKTEIVDVNINLSLFRYCLWLYLGLIVCSLWDIIYFIYILAKTNYGFIFYTIYTLSIFGLLLFTGIYGFIKCRWRDFSGYTLKIVTCIVPICNVIDVIIYYSSSMKLSFWIKLVVDLIAFILGVFLVLFIFNCIELKDVNYDNDEEIKKGLLNSEKEESPIYKF